MVGIDEVGRGPWAGPLVSAAVALEFDTAIKGVKDSKLLNKTSRESLVIAVKQNAIDIGIGWVSSSQLDKIGLSEAVKLSMHRALKQISTQYERVIIDGSIDYLRIGKSQAIPKADNSYMCVSAASIIAKVARDKYMTHLAKLFPGYGFEKHAGYGTKQHIENLHKYGISSQHRISFAPIATMQIKV